MAKNRECRRCHTTIRPRQDSHVGIKLTVRECAVSGSGDYHEAEYSSVYLCAECWSVVDKVIAENDEVSS